MFHWLSMTITASFVETACLLLCMFAFHTKASSNIWHQHREPGQLVSDAQTCFSHVYMLLSMCVFSCTLADAMKYPVWDRGVNSNSTGWPFCCGVIQLWLQGMANGCRPCSMFSIGSIQHLSTQGCILIYPPVPLSLPACRAEHRSAPWPVAGHGNLPGLSEGWIRNRTAWARDGRRQQLGRQSDGHR